MRVSKQPRQEVLSVKITKPLRVWIIQTAAKWAIRDGEKRTITDVIERAILLLQKHEEKK